MSKHRTKLKNRLESRLLHDKELPDHVFDKFFEASVVGFHKIIQNAGLMKLEVLDLFRHRPDSSKAVMMSVDFLREVPEAAMILTGCFNPEEVELLVVECCVHVVSHISAQNA